jgi:hypothetical protein
MKEVKVASEPQALLKVLRSTAFSASSLLFDLNGEASMARTKQSSLIIPPA